MAIFEKGRIPWNKGLKEWNKNYKNAGFQEGHGYIGGGSPKGIRNSPTTEFKKGMTPWNKGKSYPAIQGNKNPSWKGGISRPMAIRFKGDECEKCEEKENRLVVHHIDENLKNNIKENLMTLCYKCHCAIHSHFNRHGAKNSVR